MKILRLGYQNTYLTPAIPSFRYQLFVGAAPIKKTSLSKKGFRIIKASEAQFQAEMAKAYKESERIKQANQELANYQHKCLSRDGERSNKMWSKLLF